MFPSKTENSLSSNKFSNIPKILLRETSAAVLPKILVLSFLEWSKFIDGMPEGWLALGFCQGKNLLLWNAGRHGDVALMDRV